MSLFGPPNIEKLKAKGNVRGLVKALHHEDPTIRGGAIKALRELRVPEATEALATALADDALHSGPHSGWARRQAALGLVERRDARGLDVLIGLVETEWRGKWTENEWREMVQVLATSPHPRAIAALGRAGSAPGSTPQQREYLRYLLTEVGSPEAESAAQDIGWRDWEEARATEAALTRWARPNQRRACSICGSDAERPWSVPRADVKRALNAGYSPLATGRMPRSVAESRWGGLVRDQRREHEAQLPKLHLGSPKVPCELPVGEHELYEAWKAFELKKGPKISPDWRLCHQCAHDLGRFFTRYFPQEVEAARRLVESGDSLIERLSETDAKTRCMAARELGRTRQAVALKPLTAALKDSADSVRAAAVEALGELGRPEAVPLLFVAFRDKDPDVRKASVRALEALGGLRALVDALEQAGEALPMVEAVSMGVTGAADALARMGDPRTVGPLFAAARDHPGLEKSSAGQAAIQTLERMADAVKAAASGADPRARDALAWLVERKFHEASAGYKEAERIHKERLKQQDLDEDESVDQLRRSADASIGAQATREAAEDLLLYLWEIGDPRAEALADSFGLELGELRRAKKTQAEQEREEAEGRERQKAAQERREAENRRLREKWGGRLPP